MAIFLKVLVVSGEGDRGEMLSRRAIPIDSKLVLAGL